MLKIFNSITFLLLLCISFSSFGQKSFEGSSRTLLLDRAPQPTNLVKVIQQIPYPPQAVQAGIEGLVQVQFEVDSYGNYLSHRIVRSSHPLLSAALRGRLGCTQFVPAVHQGKKVKAWVSLPFRFKLGHSGSFRKGSVICPSEGEWKRQTIVNLPH